MPCSLVCDSLVSPPSLGTPPHISPHSGDSSEPGNSQDPPLHETRQGGRNNTQDLAHTKCSLQTQTQLSHQSCKPNPTNFSPAAVRDNENDLLWGWLGLGCKTKLPLLTHTHTDKQTSRYFRRMSAITTSSRNTATTTHTIAATGKTGIATGVGREGVCSEGKRETCTLRSMALFCNNSPRLSCFHC